MNHHPATALRPRRLALAVSLALVSLAALAPAHDARAQQTTPAPGEAADDDKIIKVQVSGTRASQQSGIDRKKNAATAMDSIVAEDVGSLPDRNIGEAISRMAGVALDRGDYGEGVTVAVRGNSADLTRVEIDGQGVQSAGGADLGATSGASGRAVEFRQLSSDLIKSVDVVKGSTADMTEGALGGGIVIKTRTGLDFKKPFVSVRVGGTQSSLNKKWQPDGNLILADKYLNGRLGLLLNASTSTVANEAHSMQVGFSGLQGYYRVADFDNSPEKTFTFQPGTLNMGDASTTTPLLQSPLLAGGTFNSATPLEVLTKSAAARTKDDCYTAFPALNATQLAAMPVASQGAAQAQRGNELITCVNQWGDYTPSGLRYFVKREIDRRQNLDLRADFKVSDALTVYAKGSYNRRRDDLSQLTYTLGNVLSNTGTAISPAYTGATYTDDLVTGVRTAIPGSGYYIYNTPSARGNAYPQAGTVVNIAPGSIVTDSSHHLTRYTLTDGQATTDQLHDIAYVTARYLQLGGTYKRDGLTAEFFVGDAGSKFRRAQKRISYTNFYGETTLQVLPNGLWSYSFPGANGFNQADPAQYVRLFPASGNSGVQALGPYNTRYTPAYTVGQQPLTSSSSPRTEAFWSPQMKETSERTAKLDLTYATPDSVPFFKRFKAGFNLRDNTNDSWAGAGSTVQDVVGTYGQPGYVAPIIVPTATARTVVQACQDTPGSLAPGGKACQYGYQTNPDPRSGLNGTLIVTPQQWQNLIASSMSDGQATSTRFFSGAKDRSAGLIDNWTQIDVEKAFAIVGAPNLNYDCVKRCAGTDGKVYDQPVQSLKERTQAFYVMGDFGFDHIPFTDRPLPFGWEIDGNLGYRYIRTTMSGSGSMTLVSIAKTDSYDELDPTKPGGTITNKFVRNTAVYAKTHDFLPIYNVALWLLPNKLVARYNRARTVARPPVWQMLPSGTCTYDETTADGSGVPQSCSSAIGNPQLMAQKNLNQNLSFELYPNKDTMFTVAVFRQKGIVGPANPQGVNNVPLFAGTTLIDPGTGVDLSQVPFNYSMYMNGTATTRKGLEFSSKTAFTFLPWMLRFTGFDANATKLRSVVSTMNPVDLLTGTPLPPEKESKYSYNLALWYDDGRLSARVAVQAVAAYYNCISGCSQQGAIQNYPATGVQLTKFPYNPGSPNFKDTTRFIDAKISYKVQPNIELFIEGRNLGNATTTNSQGAYNRFADGTPSIQDYAYAGRRIMVGLNFRNL